MLDEQATANTYYLLHLS